jgi:hypothetical protein
VVKSELLPMLEELRNTDPHDLISPDVWFVSERKLGDMYGVYLSVVQEVMKIEKDTVLLFSH